MSGNTSVILGRISGVYGVRGWLKVYSYTKPIKNILKYPVWQLSQHGKKWHVEIDQGRAHNKGIVIHIKGLDDRDEAQKLVGAEILINRDQLPQIEEGEYYWADLIGLTVKNTEGITFGKLDYLLETGANDVFVVKGERERLIPLLFDDVVVSIDLDAQLIIVNWDEDF